MANPKIGVTTISYDVIAELLALPEGCRVEMVRNPDDSRRTFRLIMTGQGMPESPTGDPVPVNLTYRRGSEPTRLKLDAVTSSDGGLVYWPPLP